MSAFVAGATGYVGREVVRQLAAAGGPVCAHVRPDSSRLEEWRERFTAAGAEVDTTPWELEALTETLRRRGIDRVFALLGTTRKRARAEGLDDPYRRVDYGLTAMLIQAAAACGSGPRFVYLSSAGVRETTRSAYLRARVDVERELRASGLPFTIARPSFITGPDREDGRPGERGAAALTDGVLALAGVLGARRLRARYRSTDSATLAGALIRLSRDGSAEGAIIESESLR